MPAQRLPKYTILLDPSTKAFQRRLRGQTDVSFSAFLRELIAHVAENPDLEELILARCTTVVTPPEEPSPAMEPPTATPTGPLSDQADTDAPVNEALEPAAEDHSPALSAPTVLDVPAEPIPGDPIPADVETALGTEEDTPTEPAQTVLSLLAAARVETPRAATPSVPAAPQDWDDLDDPAGPSPDEVPDPAPDDGFWF